LSAQKTPFLYDVFPFCKDSEKLSSDLSNAKVISAVVDKSRTSMKLTILLMDPAPPLEIRTIEELIAREYGLVSVSVTAYNARSQVTGSNGKQQQNPVSDKSRILTSGVGYKPGEAIMGRRAKDDAIPMSEVTLELGKATITGEVCGVSCKYIDKRDAWILSFDLTDYTGAIHVSKFMTGENAAKIVGSIQKGMWLTVSGKLGINRYDNDLALEPTNIVTAEKAQRMDEAPEKRVELHLHTKMSAMDAVADTAEVIRQAALWGHPAIAITDHGVVHAFPDAAIAPEVVAGKIKVIYGLEGYYINDFDTNMAVFGDVGGYENRGNLSDEFVVFDIETTGLSPCDNAIIEIGAVLYKDGRELDRFQTFVDPGTPIPYEITRLTGIADADVSGAPSQRDAVSSLLSFTGDRALIAHNADFDVGFIHEVCQRHGIAFDPCYIDTLALSRAFLPGLKNHKLDTVAAHIGNTESERHRAVADAEAAAHVWSFMIGALGDAGITEINQINSYLEQLLDRKKPSGDPKPSRARLRHIILLVKNKTGLNNLYKLVTKSHLEYFNNYPVIPKSVLQKHREGLIIGSACEAGEIYNAVSERRGSLALRRLGEFYDYFEIQPICNNMFMIYGNKPRAKNEDELRQFNRVIFELGQKLGKPVVATGDVHFLNPEHEVFRHILLHAKGFDDADSDLPVYFKTTDEMLEEFKYLGEDEAYEVVVRNSQLISDMCEAVNPLPPAKTLFLPKLERSAEDLKELTSSKLRALYGNDPPEIISKRIEAELSNILERGYDVIYMAAQKLVADSMRQGYLVGSRGSVGSSIIAFLAGITEVNALPAHYRCPDCRNSDFDSGIGWGCGADMPDKTCPSCGAQYLKDGFNIPFETFLGFDGDKVPDIDLNFSGDYQAQAHKYTTELFGTDHVFRAGTIGTVKDKTAYGFAKKYLEDKGKTVTKAEENRLARGCEGVKRTTGQHPGGLIIIPQGAEITDFCPAQHPADDSDKGIITTHFDYHRMEDNLIKLDELGHDDPTMIKMLEDLTGIRAKEIKLDDPDTMAIFTSPLPLGLPDNDEIIGAAGSIGIPEFGTPLTRQMLCDTKPEDFDTLVRLSGYSHGELVWIGNARELIQSGKAGVSDTISCRDDITLFLISKGMDDRHAFRISESVRKGNGLPKGAEEEMAGIHVPGWYIESCKKIKYLFPKAHAVAYVMMAFRIAWFKVHKPLAFYSAYFYRRSRNNSFDAEYMTRGIDIAISKIRQIRTNSDAKAKDEELLTTLEACYEFYLRGFSFADIDVYLSDSVKFLPVDGEKLRPPFVSISGLGETAARDIVENREGRDFISIDELSAACPKVSKTHLEQLKALGALRNLPESSQMSLF